MKTAKDILLLAAITCCAVLWLRMSSADKENKVLEFQLQQAEMEREAFRKTAELYKNEVAVQAELTAACLTREARAARDTAERRDILSRAKTHARTEKEQKEVVDEETRSRAVERLNRPL